MFLGPRTVPRLAPHSITEFVGDLIEIFRPVYQHWAMYVGNGYVIHLAPRSEVAGAGSSSVMSVMNNLALVKKERLSDVVGNDAYKVNNLWDYKYKPRHINLILKEAHSLVGQTLPYSIVSSNCEHFVTDLRYGKPTSRQVQQAIIGAAGGAAIVGAAVLAGLILGFGKEKDNEHKSYRR
uniref:Retinoic acid receptor responder 3 n=1 Tax=Astyanax mexicanus TaxID=7994 RepID=A0A3B1JK67_ASTMX